MTQFSIANLLIKAKNLLNHSSEAEIILAHILNQEKNYLITHNELILSDDLVQEFFNLIKERLNYKPIAQIIGYKYFWKNKFLLNESTLIPRPESEILIEEAFKLFPHLNQPLIFADLGSGTGCLGLSLLEEYCNSICYFIEQNSNAIEIIKKNTEILKLQERAIICNVSWNDFNLNTDQSDQKLDFIISNPPYIDPDLKSSLMKDVVDYEPHYALFAEENGLACYHEIINLAYNLLKKNGYLIFEIDENWVNIRWPNNFIQYKMQKDLHDLPRCLILKKLY